ncbi:MULTISPECIES: peptidase domain-containing ABC transporter [Clostridium]|uniref:ABC ATPase containing transporter n=1 Tax=Clostridium acetobutylicum (strain ATCC 824 / DSM 792 / JCM 1419 / IAM 19013 / LMG 5710 / NBRC 13948 / NRRL B-527 / VKM B-1787 / 2291 / W) TaxID=272562 RepID=Q97TM5_CLOAB|nr:MULTISPECIES: peptidase domain-containing ABC transporter [Clostridium]AAK76819.1 ABC ATPase containing transporter [Clostridium acetobutylicum ATCC 824]AEI34815.1 ABC ATPase containing transporter [Clostridium acetobutylicum DSM 1731]AWV82364.1 peptidase domain-containing ABC transporter [Clostridium acetobutylicum]MBC2395793.1 peptidase domain-containing ABC transporter [Clostridium acetobutylicum]MBC2585039.1 peptidase domain-containing ABC transporter [Clostridium acetobutylicum]
MSILKKYYCVKQHDIQDCGPACLATISKQYGLKLPISKIREAAGTDLEGTSVYGIVQAAQKLGFSTKAVRTSKKEEIFNNLPTPLIAHVIIDDVLLHFVVVHKITKKYILIADPGRGMIKYKPDEFFKIWSDVLIFLTPTAKFEKGDETKGIFQRFWGLVKVQKGLLLNIFIASILVTILGIAGSFYYEFLIDDILPNNLKASLHSISIAMLILLLFKIVTEFFRKTLLLYMAQNIDVPLLLGYYNHVVKLPMNFFGTRKVGEIISRFNDGDKIRNAISSVTLTLMIDVLMAVVGGAILYLQNLKLFFTCFVPIVLYLILVFGFKNKLKKVNRRVMEDNASLTSYLVESLEGIETVKAFNGEGLVRLKTENKFLKFMKSYFKHGYTYNVQGTLMDTISGGFGICLLWFGGSLVLKGEVTIGELISFNALLAYFIQPIGRLINLQPQLQEAIVASDRLGEILDLELEKSDDESIKPETLAGCISLENVSFAYGMRDNVLNDINISIHNGEKIALVGESGSGKTTIAKLLMGFYKIDQGKIILNNYYIDDIDKETLRSKISYISQDSFFFSGTIKENLEFVGDDVTYEKMVDACKKAHIHEYIESLPLKYKTPLEEKGSNLSGGQRQRLSIARALLKKPEILIMDEATSNLDSITERAIQRTLEECTENVTTIVIAHRLSTIKKCQKIYVMDKGRIIEEGSHRELLDKGGYYYRLWTEQTLDDEEQKIVSNCI